MGDIAQILGVAPPNASSLLSRSRHEEDVDYDVLALTATTKKLPRSVQLQRLPKDVLDLVVGSSNSNSNNETSIELPTAVPMMNRRTPAAVVGSKTSSTANSSVPPLGGGEDCTRVVKIGNKWISTNPSVRLWKWLPFTSSARNDGLLLHHWVRPNVEYFDYPYARFNIHLDTVSYYDTTTTTTTHNNNNDNNSNHHHHMNEYRALQLHTDPNWSQSETDLLLELVQRYELRWPVIYDRWIELFGSNNSNSNNNSSDNDLENNDNHHHHHHHQQQQQQQHRFQIEDLQHRYYTVAAIINQSRITTEAEYEARNLTLQTNAASANLLANTVRTNTTNAATTTTATAAAAVPPSAMEGVTPITNATGTTNTNSNNNNTDDNENEMMKQRAVETLLIETAAARALATTEPQYQPLIQNIGTGTSNKIVFDLDKERERRQHMVALWNRSKAEELEEIELRKELKQIDVQLRKLKKSGAHIAAAKAKSNNHIASTTTHQSSSRTATPIQFGSSSGGNNVPNETIAVDLTTLPTLLDQAFVSTAMTTTTAEPIAMAGIPYLQSCRLLPPGIGDGATINQALLSRMDTVLDELNIPQNPIATKRVCDVYDTLRRDILTLLILQKEVLQKEGILATKHLHLAKKSGNTHVDDEEALLGIPPPKSSTPSVRAPSSTTTTATSGGGGGGGSGKGSRNTKSGKTDGPKRKASTTPKAGAITMGDTTKKDDGTGGPNHLGKATSVGKQPRKPSVPGTKRKRKSDDSGPKVVVNHDMSIPTGVTATVAVTAPLPSSVPGTTVSSSSTIPPGSIPKPTVTDTSLTTKPVTTSTESIVVNDIGGIAPATATSGSVATTTVATTSTPTESKASAKKRAKKSNT